MRKGFFVLYLFFSLLSTNIVMASIYTCNSTGEEKTSFYVDEIVYVASRSNITNESRNIGFYVVAIQDLTTGMNLSSKAVAFKNITTNTSGFVPITSVWNKPMKGNYGIVADLNGNQTLDSEDLIYDGGDGGFSISEKPVRVLKVSKGENSPKDHIWHENMTRENEMLQVLLKVESDEDVKIKSFVLVAKGSGNDEKGIRYVVVCEDWNGNGKCEFGEKIVGIGRFTKNDGIAILTLQDFRISANSSEGLVFYYVMNKDSKYIEGNYSFELSFIEAYGVNSNEKVVLEGLPINSAIKTVFPVAETTTTTSTSTTTLPTTTTLPQNKELEEKKTNFIIGLALASFAVVVILLIFYYFFLKTPTKVYHYKPK